MFVCFSLFLCCSSILFPASYRIIHNDMPSCKSQGTRGLWDLDEKVRTWMHATTKRAPSRLPSGITPTKPRLSTSSRLCSPSTSIWPRCKPGSRTVEPLRTRVGVLTRLSRADSQAQPRSSAGTRHVRGRPGCESGSRAGTRKSFSLRRVAHWNNVRTMRTVEEEAAAEGDGRLVSSRRLACCVAKSTTVENVDPRTRRDASRAFSAAHWEERP